MQLLSHGDPVKYCRFVIKAMALALALNQVPCCDLERGAGGEGAGARKRTGKGVLSVYTYIYIYIYGWLSKLWSLSLCVNGRI